MARQTHDFEVSLRRGRLGTHRTTLGATSRDEAMQKATQDAVATSGGDLADWSVTACDKLDAAPARKAA